MYLCVNNFPAWGGSLEENTPQEINSLFIDSIDRQFGAQFYKVTCLTSLTLVQLELLLNRMLIFLDLGFLLLAEKDF